MKIIIDDKIPYIKEAAEKIADEVIYAPGKDFTRAGSCCGMRSTPGRS